MNRGMLLTLVGVLALPSLALGQDVSARYSARYGVTLGLALYQARDEALNGLRHRGPAVSAGIFREGISGAGLHRIEASFAFAPLTDRYSPDRSSVLFHPSIEIRYAKKAIRVAGDVFLFVGGAAGWSTRFSFYENWDQAHAYWLTASHLGLTTSLVGGLGNGNSFHLELDAPLLAVVSRPPERFEYKEVNPSLRWVFGEIHSGPRVTSVHEHAAFTATLSFLRPGGGFLRERFFWQTAYTSTRLPHSRPFTSLTHMLGISQFF